MATATSSTQHPCDFKASCEKGCKCNCTPCLASRLEAKDPDVVAAQPTGSAHRCAFQTGHEDPCTCNCAPCVGRRTGKDASPAPASKAAAK